MLMITNLMICILVLLTDKLLYQRSYPHLVYDSCIGKPGPVIVRLEYNRKS